MTTDGRLLVLGALGLLGAATVARGSKGVVRRGRGPSRKASMPNVQKGERYESIDRGSGDPQVWQIDLKHSIWSHDDGVWADRAPLVWRAIWEGIVEGKIEEHGEALVVKASGSNTDRFGEVSFRPHGEDGLVEVDVSFKAEGHDEDETIDRDDAFTVTGDEDGFDEAMRRIDLVESNLIKASEF